MHQVGHCPRQCLVRGAGFLRLRIELIDPGLVKEGEEFQVAGHVAVIDLSKDEVVKYLPCDPGCHGIPGMFPEHGRARCLRQPGTERRLAAQRVEGRCQRRRIAGGAEEPVDPILDHLTELVGPHFYARHDLHLDRQEYPARRQEIYGRLQQQMPDELGGSKVIRSRTDDGFKFYLEDGSWVLIRFSGTEPLIRVYSEASSKERVEQLLAALEEKLGLRQLV